MATKPARKPASARARKPARAAKPAASTKGHSPASLQDVIDELGRVRDHAEKEVRRQLDPVVKRLRDVAGDLRERTSEQASSIEQTVEDAWQQVATLAIRAQKAPEGLTALGEEIRKRRAELAGAARPAARKPAAKKPAARKPAARKPAAKKTPAKGA